LHNDTKTEIKMHNDELAKKYHVSPVLTQKECPAKLGEMYL